MNITRCTDAALIRRAMTHPKVYPHITDDGCEPAEQFEPYLSPALFYLAADDDGFQGVFLFHPQNHACFEVHTCLLPSAWGRAAGYGRAAVQWMFENTPCCRVVTNVPVHNRLAFRLARQVGMQSFGTNPKSFLKNGVLHDQHMLGMNKE